MTKGATTTRMVAAIAGVILAGSAGLAQVPANKDQLKCETGTDRSVDKFLSAKAKCVQTCITTARKTSHRYGCFPNDAGEFGDPATDACIHDPTKGAEEKATTSITNACAKDCPACYSMNNNCAGSNLVSGEERAFRLYGWFTRSAAR